MLAVTTQSLPLGETAPSFGDLKSADGRRYSLSDFDSSSVLALVFISNGCPTVRVYNERLVNLQAEYAARGVQLVAINSNNPHLSPIDSYSEMAARSEDSGYNFPYLKDEDGSVAHSYGAIATPHAFVFDRERKLRYRGRIDDSRDPANVTTRELRDAIAALVDEHEVEVPETQPFGCAIVR
ncbi:MAG TPA: thioredoxin family protein [Actinomycetota bacterium]|nr:thioredoxin family protein [Actinomycetota bacterium]